MSSRTDLYDLVANQARIEEAGGLAKERSVLLLWFLRNVIGLDALDAYDYICDGDLDQGVDGLYLESAGSDDAETLTVFQSKYTTGPNTVGSADIKHLVGTANHFRTAEGLEALLASNIEPRLRALIEDFGLLEKLRDGRLADGRLRLRLILVTTGHLSDEAERDVVASNLAAGTDELRVWEIDDIGPIAKAVASRDQLAGDITTAVPAAEFAILKTSAPRVAVAAIQALEIVKWTGIDDRSLFDLNVRHELGRNRVRDQLDDAVRRVADHENFLAYHNGVTVVCDSFEQPDAVTLVLHRPSVVNGAQSIIAFDRQAGSLTNALKVVVKIVEVVGRPQLAREVSRRSNTQNPVNPRMLMANSGPQLRIASDFEKAFPTIAYITRPDATVASGKARTISNDDAAQLLCAIYREMPELAVKRVVLFESDNHAKIFNPDTTAAHIVLADDIASVVDELRDAFPERYRESWKLTKLVAAYLVGQILRATATEEGVDVLADPSAAVADAATHDRVASAVRMAAFTLKMRVDELDGSLTPDDYRKDFKNEEKLRELGREARKYYLLRRSMPSDMPAV